MNAPTKTTEANAVGKPVAGADPAAPPPSGPASGYAVRFRLQIHSNCSTVSGGDVWMEKNVVLPIPPCVGMSVSQGDWEVEIEKIYLPLDRGTIEVWSEDKELYEADGRRLPRRPIAEIVAEYEEAGWAVEARDQA